MGIESFFIELFVNNKQIDTFINNSSNYAESLEYETTNETILLKGVLVSFMPVCNIMYNICVNLKSGGDICIRTLNVKETFDKFDCYKDFFNWMYNLWYDKICKFNTEMGAFIINKKLYYKTYRRLRKKKYYKKLNY